VEQSNWASCGELHYFAEWKKSEKKISFFKKSSYNSSVGLSLHVARFLKTFFLLRYLFRAYKLERLSIVRLFSLVFYFRARLENSVLAPGFGLLVNTKLDQKILPGTNALAYFERFVTKQKKGFMRVHSCG
jgi:hypothetical protein